MIILKFHSNSIYFFKHIFHVQAYHSIPVLHTLNQSHLEKKKKPYASLLALHQPSFHSSGLIMAVDHIPFENENHSADDVINYQVSVIIMGYINIHVSLIPPVKCVEDLSSSYCRIRFHLPFFCWTLFELRRLLQFNNVLNITIYVFSLITMVHSSISLHHKYICIIQRVINTSLHSIKFTKIELKNGAACFKLVQPSTFARVLYLSTRNKARQAQHSQWWHHSRC